MRGITVGAVLGYCFSRGRRWLALAAFVLGAVAFVAEPTWGSERA